MTFENTYRFLLDGVVIYPIISDDFKMDWKKESDSFYFRRAIDAEIELYDTDYTGVRDSDISTRFDLTIQFNDGSGWSDFYEGYFFKSDCEFNDDDQLLTVKPRNNDGYDDFSKVLNNEYNIPLLPPASTSVNYKARPVLQIMYGDAQTSTIMNISGTAQWEELTAAPVSLSDLVPVYGFLQYAITASVKYYLRYLTSLDEFNGVTTIDRPEDDVSVAAQNYRKISQQVDFAKAILTSPITESQLEPSIYGKINCNLVTNWENLYYSEYISGNPNTIEIPIGQAQWGCLAQWYEYDETLNQYELTNSADITILDTYKLPNLISIMLEQDSDIVHREEADFSEFFYSDVNPIDGLKIYPMITPKSNVVNLFYTDPARKGLLKLVELLNSLITIYNVYWHIEVVDGEKRLRLEHISWYENGGTYGEQTISVDLTQSLDTRNQLSLSFDQNKYKYNKSNMPQRYEYKWADDVSDIFEGVSINSIGDQVTEGNIISLNTGKITSDIDIIISKDNISLDGFAILGAEFDGSIYSLPLPELNIDGDNIFTVQNGYLSFRYLHEKFHGYGKPTKNIELNGEEVEADSVTRNKQQEVNFTYGNLQIDPLKLIITGLGAGQVETMSLNLISNNFEILINHDTE